MQCTSMSYSLTKAESKPVVQFVLHGKNRFRTIAEIHSEGVGRLYLANEFRQVYYSDTFRSTFRALHRFQKKMIWAGKMPWHVTRLKSDVIL